MRTIIPCLIIALLSFSTVLLQAAERPNIVLVMTDDQGWADIGRNRELHPKGEQIKTPNLDALSQRSLWFTRAYAAAPNCSPTRASVLTGRHPWRTGVYTHGRPLRLEEGSIAADLAAVGYATGHFGKWHLEGRRGSGVPVAADDPRNPGAFGFQAWCSATNFYDLSPRFGSPDGVVPTEGEGSITTVAQANAFITAQVKARRPFFAVVWTGSPHNPHKPVKEDLEACGGDEKLAEIRGIDRAVGELYGQLQQLGVADDTLLWFTSDNGSQDAGGCGGLRGKKGQVWEGGLRVPAFVHWPGKIEPGVSDVPIVTSDIRPTLLALTGAKQQKPMLMDGIDLLPVFAGTLTQRPQPIGFWHGGNDPTSTVPIGQGHAAFFDGRWKYHRVAKKGKEFIHLYDLVADPNEENNQVESEPKVAERMAAQLQAWQESVVKSSDGGDY